MESYADVAPRVIKLLSRSRSSSAVIPQGVLVCSLSAGPGGRFQSQPRVGEFSPMFSSRMSPDLSPSMYAGISSGFTPTPDKIKGSRKWIDENSCHLQTHPGLLTPRIDRIDPDPETCLQKFRLSFSSVSLSSLVTLITLVRAGTLRRFLFLLLSTH